MNETDAAGGLTAPQAVRPAVYGRNYSYFSHRIFVAFMPEDFHDYLHRLISVTPAADGKVADSELLEVQVAPWVLLHRSQLNALSLSREIEFWRSGDALRLPPEGRIRTDYHHRLALTLQFALELELAEAADSPMLQERPRLQLAAIDAAYYVSRQRAEQDRRARSGDEVREADFDIDLSQTGREAFAAYLLRRMNLNEDRGSPVPKRESDSSSERSGPDSAVLPLSDEEINWLYGIAAAVANTLCSCTPQDDLVARWNKRNAALWTAKGIPQPDAVVYGALLIKDPTGDEVRPAGVPPLQEVPLKPAPSGDGLSEGGKPVNSFRFRWRKPPFGEPHWAKSLKDIAEHRRPARTFVENLDAMLRKVLYGEAHGAGLRSDIDKQPLRLLSDRYRVLPTTPAWAAVLSVIESLRQAEQGIGNIDSLQNEESHLQQYANMLGNADAVEVVVLVIVLGAALAGLRAGPGAGSAVPVPARLRPSTEEWSEAFEVLRDGLALAVVDLGPTADKLRTVYLNIPVALGPPPLARGPSAMVSAPDGSKAAPTDDPFMSKWPTTEALDEAVTKAYRAGCSSVFAPTALQTAWKHLEDRLLAVCRRTVPVPPAHAIELACAMRRVGPGAFLPLNLETAGCRTWTRTLLMALRRGDWNPALPPLTLAIHALERLGIRALNPSLRQSLLHSLDLPDEALTRLQQHIERTGLWSGSALGAHVALVLGPPLESLAEGWPVPPGLGLVLAMTEAELADSGGLLGAWLRTLPEPVLVAFEPWSLRGEGTTRFNQWLAAHLVSPVRIWLYRDGQKAPDSPALVEPRSADDLWRLLPPPSPAASSSATP